MAQLPGILQNSPLPITYKDFRETSSHFLTARDKKILEQLSLEPPRKAVKTGSAVVDGFYLRERALRLSLERIRAVKLKRDVSSMPEEDGLISGAFETVQIARTASGFESPLDAEMYLMRARIDFIDILQVNHFFDSDAVFAYGLMLLLRERSDRFTAEAGRTSYTTIYNQILGE